MAEYDFKKFEKFQTFPPITQFFNVPFGVFRREIAGNGHRNF
jgi:hypothetical protein